MTRIRGIIFRRECVMKPFFVSLQVGILCAIVAIAGYSNPTGSRLNSGVVTTIAGTASLFDSPGGIAVDSSGNLYIADSNNKIIRKITTDGVVTTLAGSGLRGHADGPGTAASFDSPGAIAVGSNGNVYVTDFFTNMIRKISPDGMVTTLAGSGETGHADGPGKAASFQYPDGVALDSSGNVYVADMSNNLVRKITSDGVVTTLAGSGKTGHANGRG